MSLTPAQVELRKTGLGASDIAAVAVVNPWKSPMNIFLLKTGRTESQESARGNVGHIFEAAIALWYQGNVGASKLTALETLIHNDEPWMLATPDRLAEFDDGREQKLVEIKNVGRRVSHHWVEGLPYYVTVQVLWQEEVTGILDADVAALIDPTAPELFGVPFDSELVADLKQIGWDFWTKCVKTDTPPSVDGSDAWTQHLRDRYPDGIDPMRSRT